MSDHRKVVIKLLFKLREVTNVIDPLVKSAGKLRRDGLQLHPFIRQCSKDDQQLRRRLRRIGFIHRNLGDEFALARLYVPINFRSRLHREQVFPGHLPNVFPRNIKRLVNALDRHATDQLRMALNERRHRIPLGRLPDKVGDVDRKKIRARKVLVHRVHVDVVGVHVPTLMPSKLLDRHLGRVVHTLRLRPYETVFAV